MKTFASFVLVAAATFFSADAFAQARLAPSFNRAAVQDSAGLAADVKIAYVDMERVVALSAEGQAASAKLDELRSKMSAEVAARSKQVEAIQQKLTQGATVLNDVARARLQREFQRAQVDFQRFSEDAQAELQEAQQQALQAFNAQLFPVIQQAAKERDLWAVFGSETAVIWINPAADLTEDIAKRLDASAAKGK